MSDALDLLARDLANPADAGGIALLLELWRHVDMTIHCRRPLDLEDHPDLPVRIRGGFGQALARVPPPVTHRNDPFNRPAPFSVLFGDFNDARGQVLAKPFVIDVDVRQSEVVVRLRLIGRAMFWANQARDALIEALDGGVAIKSGSPHRVVLEPVEMETEFVDGIPWPRATREVVMLLRSPMAIRSGRAVGLAIPALAHSLLQRAVALAAWQGLALAVDRADVASSIGACEFDTSAVLPVNFERNSRRQPGRPIPVVGWLGRIGLTGHLEPIAPYLALGTVMHAGSHAALGLGRYDLAVYG